MNVNANNITSENEKNDSTSNIIRTLTNSHESKSKSSKKNIEKLSSLKKYPVPKINKSNFSQFSQDFNSQRKSTNMNSTKNSYNKKTQIKKISNEINKFEYIYSPRTTYVQNQLSEEKLYNDLGVCFDPIAIKIIKSYFKERLGVLNETEFITIIKNNLHTWHPELPQRTNILIKLLLRLFNDIDLNNNQKIEWEEFINYILTSSDNIFQKKVNYKMKFYIPSKNIIPSEFNEIITHAFYITKFNLIGVVLEGKSIIYFYDPDTCKRLKMNIDIKEVQNIIDKLEISLLEQKSLEILHKKEEEKILKILQHQEHLKQKYLSLNTLKIKLENLKNEKNKINKINNEKNDKNKHLNSNYSEENPTRSSKKIKDFNKKLTILCTCFIEEYNLLMISSSNNIISAWKFDSTEFKNINIIIDENKAKDLQEKFHLTCSLLSPNLPQTSMDWEPVSQKLYTGQSDGKILVWDIFNLKSNEEFFLDFKQAKLKHDNENFNKINNIYNEDEESILEKSYFNNPKKKNKINDSIKDRQAAKFSNSVSFLSNIKNDLSRDGVSCLKVLGKTQLLGAGYLNGCVIIWDTVLKDYRKFYSDQNTGIYQIVFNSEKRLIYTCGFDHDIFVYDPFIDGYSINKLEGHKYSINSIACNEKLNEFISIDIYGNIKIWDLNNYFNFQTINLNETVNSQINKKLSSNQKMILLNKSNKIFTYGEKLMMFNKENSGLPDLTDSQSILGCFYRENNYQLVTVCLKKIKVWNIFNGKIIKIFDNFSQNQNSEITSFCTGYGKKILFIGESFGQIIGLDLNNGKILIKIENKSNEIISLKHSNKNRILISLSTDGKVNIYKENGLNNLDLLKEFSLDIYKITIIEYSEKFSRLILGSNQGDIRFFDVEHLRHDSDSRQENDEKKNYFRVDQINTLFIFEEYPICLSCHDSGINKFIIIPPNSNKYTNILEFKNINIKDNKEHITKIYSCIYVNNILYTGDLFGFIHCYSIKKLFDIIKSTNNEINLDTIKLIEKNSYSSLIQDIFCFEAHKEFIKEIIYPNIIPHIIITTGNDRRVKLFNIETGEYIDELNQASERFRELPLGIKYYLVDPFVSKVDEKYNPKQEIIYRSDLKNFKTGKKKSTLEHMRKNDTPISEYCDKISEINALEKLYSMNKKMDSNDNRSTFWKFFPDLDLIKKKEEENFEKKLNDLKNVNENCLNNKDYKLITNKFYTPAFLKEMDEESFKNFKEALNDKVRKTQLTTSKIKQINNDYKSFEKQKKKVLRKINYEAEMEFLGFKQFHKTINPQALEKLEKERYFLYGLKKNFKTNDEKFNNYKEDFQHNLNKLEKSIEKKIALKYFATPTRPNFNIYSTYKNSSHLRTKSQNIFNKGKILPRIRGNQNISKSISITDNNASIN